MACRAHPGPRALRRIFLQRSLPHLTQPSPPPRRGNPRTTLTDQHFRQSELDTARVARRTWEQFAKKGYGLANVCEAIGHEYVEHDALEDAKAAGKVLLAAMAKTTLTVEGWLARVQQPIALRPDGRPGSAPITRDGNPDGPLAGEVLVFTGALMVPRAQAADMAASVGCEVAANVTKATTLLVVGDQDARKLAGNPISSKQRKAEELLKKGQPIRILRESDFQKLVTVMR